MAIFLFNVFRWSELPQRPPFSSFYSLATIWGGQIIFPILLMGIYWLSGYYNDASFRSRAQELITTLWSAILGSLTVFFLAVVNDSPWRRSIVFEHLFIAAALIFICVYTGRFLITRIVVKGVHDRHNTDGALMLGTDSDALGLARRINSLPKGMGINVVKFVRLGGKVQVETDCSPIGIIDRSEMRRYCADHAINHLILTPRAISEGINLAEFMRLANDLSGSLFLAPDINTVAFASGRHFNVMGEPLVCISSPNISASTANVKRAIDVVFSSLALIALSPLFAVLAIKIKLDSHGPVFFRQTRLGRGGKPFRIIKFRSMVTDAEADGIMLTTDNDTRVTRFGRFMRKYRLDELPQFWNVVRGEMSLVGPRPERREFAEQIAARVPLYPMLYQVRPGITSWGQVRYGYASTVDQMIERLRYDLIYLESISVITDIKILLHTINTVISGSGK
ncbi:MAG: sugar transferase [Bacteroides sp.]|nr:sugar transferase [Bacteroides sp.]MCM1380101.1 sugar transferase [Bacteroides sp.]MCM1445666.1 sugar transferase [Prevotella sp.]